MGYTHYFSINKQPDFEQWKPLRDAMQKIFKQGELGGMVQFESNDSADPVANDTLIRFNGIDEAGHETFYLSREDSGFQFCKTAYKPYDSLVTACLALAEHYAPGCYDIGSDGTSKDWEIGIEIAEAAIGGHIENPITDNY